MKKLNLIVMFLLLAVFAGAAQAITTYSFTNASSVSGIASQFFVDVEEINSSTVLFGFRNESPAGTLPTITGVNFKDGSLLWLSKIVYDGNGSVSFTRGAASPNNDDRTRLSTGFLVNEDGSGQNGINPGEWLGIQFQLMSGQTYSDVINELNDSSIQISLFVNDGTIDVTGAPNLQVLSNQLAPIAVPVPGAFMLSGIGLGFVGFIKRRRAL